MAPSPQAPLPRSSTPLEGLLRDLGTSVQRGGGAALAGGRDAGRLPSGIPAIDRVLGGGVPRGRVSEVVGPGSSGRTSLAFALLAQTTTAGECVAVIDGADGFDPASARAAGVVLPRVLWVRPPSLTEALRCVEHVLQAGGFPLVLLDVARVTAAHAANAPRRRRSPQDWSHIPHTAWPRLRKATAASSSAFVLLGNTRLAGTFADLAVEMAAGQPRFEAQPAWFSGLEGRVSLVRNRAGPDTGQARVRFGSDARAA